MIIAKSTDSGVGVEISGSAQNIGRELREISFQICHHFANKDSEVAGFLVLSFLDGLDKNTLSIMTEIVDAIDKKADEKRKPEAMS